MTVGHFGFLLLVGCIYFLKYFALSQDVAGTEVYDAEVRLKRDLLTNYTKDVLPPHNASSPVMIRLSVSIVSIKDLDASQQTLTTEAWLRLNWNDSRLIWDPKDYAGITMLHFASHKLWQPDIKLINSANMREMEVQVETFMIVFSSGDVVWIPPGTLYSLCEVDLKYYPYDKHNCTYHFASWSYDGHRVDIENKMQETNKPISLSDLWNTKGEWEIVQTSAQKTTVHYQCCPEGYPYVTYSVIIQRRSPFYGATIMSPLIAVTFLILASFWMSPKSYHRIILNIVSLLTTFILLMQLSSTLPAVGNYCPAVMTFTGILFVLSAVATVISMIFMRIAVSTSKGQTPEYIRRIVQSFNMKLFCVVIPASDNGQGIDSMNLVAEHDSTISKNQAISNPNLWLMFLSLIDRLLFIICFIIITTVTISASV